MYVPTSDASNEVMESFYEDLQSLLDSLPHQDIKIVMRDFNAKVGDDVQIEGLIGKHGLGVCNERRHMLIDFCIGNSLCVTNTMFQQHPRRKYTWTSADGTVRNQIDFITVQSRWKSSIINCHKLPGADCGTDHQLLVAIWKLRLKRIKKDTDTVARFNLHKLQEGQYSVEIVNWFSALSYEHEAKTPEEKWMQVKDIMLEVAEGTLGRKKATKKQKWMSQPTLELVNKRRQEKEHHSVATDEYKHLHSQVTMAIRKDKETYIQQLCEELEKQANKGNLRGLFQMVKKLGR